MSRLAVVPSVIETTDHVDPKQAFDFWRSTALAPFGDVTRVHARAPFRAKRLAVVGSDWILTHTVSSPVGLQFGKRHVDRQAPEMVVIGLAIEGTGYQEQRDRGARIGAGDISFLTRNQPFVAGTQSDYAEIRLAIARRTFEAWIGSADTLAGRAIACGAETARNPKRAAFESRFRALAASAAWMSESEADLAVEGVLHLLGNLTQDPDDRPKAELSREAVASLARAHIQRRLHDPDFGPRAICAALGLSRAHLYRAFADTEGIAAAIRDARLDLAYSRLTSPRNDGLRIATIAYACGFSDVPTFNRAFRRHYGVSPGDLRASCCPAAVR